MAFLAVADVKRSADWSKARVRVGKETLKSRDIIAYLNQHFGESISMGSYDDIRRKDLKLPVVAGIIIASANKPNAARNDPTRGYSLSPEYVELIRRFGQPDWAEVIEEFMEDRPALADRLDAARQLEIVPINLPDGRTIQFSPGTHNMLQKAIIEQFLPRYGHGAEVFTSAIPRRNFWFGRKQSCALLNFLNWSTENCRTLLPIQRKRTGCFSSRPFTVPARFRLSGYSN